MLKIDDEFSLSRDSFGWTVHQTIPAKKKDGSLGTRSRLTYHSNLTQCFASMVDRSCSRCHTLEDVKQLMVDFEGKVKAWTRVEGAKPS